MSKSQGNLFYSLFVWITMCFSNYSFGWQLLFCFNDCYMLKFINILMSIIFVNNKNVWILGIDDKFVFTLYYRTISGFNSSFFKQWFRSVNFDSFIQFCALTFETDVMERHSRDAKVRICSRSSFHVLCLLVITGIELKPQDRAFKTEKTASRLCQALPEFLSVDYCTMYRAISPESVILVWAHGKQAWMYDQHDRIKIM